MSVRSIPPVSTTASLPARSQNSQRALVVSAPVRSGTPSWTRMVSKSVTVSVVAVVGTIASTASAGSSEGSNGGATVEVGAISDRGVGWSRDASSPQPATSSMEASTTSVRGSMRPSLPNLVRVATRRRIERPLNGARARVGIRRIGVEEELMLVDPETGFLTAVAEQAVRAGDDEESEVEHELFRQQIETMTEPCETLDDLAGQLRAGRRAVSDSAAEAGAAAAAVPTPVLVDEDTSITPKPRYERIREEFGELARTALVSRDAHPRRRRGRRAGGARARRHPPVAAGADRGERQLAVHARSRHGLRQLALADLEPLAQPRQPARCSAPHRRTTRCGGR